MSDALSSTSRPDKSIDKANVESFNGRLPQESLNATWFMSLDDARGKTKHGGSTATRVDHTPR